MTDDLRAILALPAPPLDRVALALAADAYPGLDADACLAQLDRIAAPLAARLAHARTPLAQAGALGTYLFDELGFRGDEESYYDPRNSYLNEVLVRRVGISITLAVLLVAVGARAGLALEGVGFPGHFLVRLGGEGGTYLDPFFRARVLNRDALERLLRRALGASAQLSQAHLAPASPRAVAVRILTNLKAIYEARREHARALVVCDRLVDLTAAAEHRRDRGTHALALDATAAGIADLEAYLEERPAAADAAPIRAVLERARGARRRPAN